MLKTILTAALFAASLPAAAQAEQVTRHVHVSYADLDLRHPNDVKELDRRLRVAVAEVCPETQPQDRQVSFSVLRCRHAAHVGAAAQRAAALARIDTRSQVASIAEGR